MMRSRINDQIRVPAVRLIDGDNNLGIIPTNQARKMAYEKELDLVEVAPDSKPPVCRIMDYGKFKYEQQVKDRKNKRKTPVLKEVSLKPNIAEHDLETKINQARKFLESGNKVKIRLFFNKKSQLSHSHLGFTVVNGFLDKVSDLIKSKPSPRMEGRNITCVVEPNLEG